MWVSRVHHWKKDSGGTTKMQTNILRPIKADGDNYLDSSRSGEDTRDSDEEVSESVTLCIAAECLVEEEHYKMAAIGVCCDWRAQTGHESGLVGTDDANKIKKISDEMCVLMAGDPSDARELLAACRGAIDNFLAVAEETKW